MSYRPDALPETRDPISEIVTLLNPTARLFKQIEGAGQWHMQRRGPGEPFYCVVLEGQCQMRLNGAEPLTLQAGDFLLAPAAHELVNQSMGETVALSDPVQIGENHYRLGRRDGPAQMTALIGHCGFASPDAQLLVPLLPQQIHIPGQARLATLVQLIGDETRTQRPAREVVLTRLLEVMLIEALRGAAGPSVHPGLARALADERVAPALHAIHARPAQPWTVQTLAQVAALSRSAFFARFSNLVGMAPMRYVLVWRMALAKRMLREQNPGIEQVAQHVGYRSASTFSVAFTRHVGMAPAYYARLDDPLPPAPLL